MKLDFKPGNNDFNTELMFLYMLFQVTYTQYESQFANAAVSQNARVILYTGVQVQRQSPRYSCISLAEIIYHEYFWRLCWLKWNPVQYKSHKLANREKKAPVRVGIMKQNISSHCKLSLLLYCVCGCVYACMYVLSLNTVQLKDVCWRTKYQSQVNFNSLYFKQS